LAAQGQSSDAPASTASAANALQDLFSQIDGNGDGAINKSEFASGVDRSIPGAEDLIFAATFQTAR